MWVGRGEAVTGDAGRGCRGRGESICCWLHLPVLALSITTSRILHLTCTISKSLVQMLLPCSLMNSTTLTSHAKPRGKPGFWGHTWRPAAGTENALLCTFCITWQDGRADCGCPSPSAAGGSSPHLSCHPQSLSLAGCCKPCWGGRAALPQHQRVGRRGMPLGCLPSWLKAWCVGGIPVPYVGSW